MNFYWARSLWPVSKMLTGPGPGHFDRSQKCWPGLGPVTLTGPKNVDRAWARSLLTGPKILTGPGPGHKKNHAPNRWNAAISFFLWRWFNSSPIFGPWIAHRKNFFKKTTQSAFQNIAPWSMVKNDGILKTVSFFPSPEKTILPDEKNVAQAPLANDYETKCKA